MFAAAVSTAKLNPVAARNQRCVAAKAGKYDEELIKTAVSFSSLMISIVAAGVLLSCSHSTTAAAGRILVR